ncbi:OmpW/AlkL family protein [Roseomonas chloroacetimidivorans]|uniref:OmpW/AlkL family protein n=1 Tax=Roseomonas chloroacetimidivorans TaxID=1766656 RepID=UPI003C7427D5
MPSSVRLPCLFGATFLVAAVATPRPGLAQENPEVEQPFFVRLGYGLASYRTTGRAAVAGQSLNRARVALGDVSFAALELGWRFAPDWSVSVLGGLPPTVALHGRGDFADQGVLRKVTYGSVMLGVQYHPFTLGRFEPFVGAGLNYTAIFRTHGGSMSELHVADNAGPYVQVGGQVHLTSSLSAFVDARKTWLSFDAKGVAGGAPVRVSIDPDPVSVTLGLSYRF